MKIKKFLKKLRVMVNPKKKRPPRLLKTGEKMTMIDWQIIGRVSEEWNLFEKRKLRLFQLSYPKPVTSKDLKEEFLDGPWTMSDFSKMNHEFLEFGRKSGHWYKVLGTGDGFQIFKMAPFV